MNKAQILLGFAVAVSGATAPLFASAENSARYLVLENCGAYDIDDIIVQKKKRYVSDLDNLDEDGNPGLKKNEGSWKNTDGKWSDYAFSLGTTQAACFDLRELETTKSSNYMFRLKAKITAGETENCDSTNYATLSDGQMRIMQMGGTTHNNNHCGSRKYVDPITHGRGQEYLQHCSEDGGRTRNISC